MNIEFLAARNPITRARVAQIPIEFSLQRGRRGKIGGIYTRNRVIFLRGDRLGSFCVHVRAKESRQQLVRGVAWRGVASYRMRGTHDGNKDSQFPRIRISIWGETRGRT